jgi:hypothetical protein
VSREILNWLNDARAYAEIQRDLLALRESTAQPGACGRAAERIVQAVEQRRKTARRAA